MKNEQKQLRNFAKAASRQEAINAGAYDGRFRKRVFKDRKKEAKKNGWA